MRALRLVWLLTSVLAGASPAFAQMGAPGVSTPRPAMGAPGVATPRPATPTPAPAAAPPPAGPLPGVVGEAPVAAGNLASARERAVNEAFRQLVDSAFASLMAEAGAAPSPALTALRATWLQRPKRLVTRYRVLDQSEQGGILRVRLDAELDQSYLHREFDRARGAANKGVTPGAVPIVSDGAPEAVTALVGALTTEGIRTQLQPGTTTPDEAGLRALATRSGRGVVMLVTGRAAGEGSVRGTGQQSVECHLSARLVSSSGDASGDKASGARGFQGDEKQARTACFARATRDLVPALLPELRAAAGGTGDLHIVTLDLDLNEPAALSPVLRGLRKVAGPASAEVRRVAVGKVEIRVTTRLGPAPLLSSLGRELAGVATVVTAGQPPGDRVAAQVRLVPETLPPPGPTQAQPPGASPTSPSGAPAPASQLGGAVLPPGSAGRAP